jgi:hypothetical protein
MSFVAVAVVGAGVLAAGATTYSASSAASSASQANAQNAANVSNTNELNLQEFLQSRGSTGSAIYPIYAAGTEQQLYNDALSTYNATGGANLPTLAQYQSLVNQSQPAAQGATNAVNGVFNGQTLNTELQQAAPVQAANIALAQTQKQGSLEALQQTLNNIKSIQAGKGYSGDSYTNQLLNFQARQSANTQGAQALAQAQLQNTSQTQGIQENAINRALQNVNLPGQVAQNNINLLQAPTNALDTNQVNRQNLFANFRIGTSAPYQYSASPLVQPVASTGQIAGQAGASLASGIGNTLATNQLINALNGNTAASSAALTPGISSAAANSLVNSGTVGAASAGSGLLGNLGASASASEIAGVSGLAGL